jgi:hypothetical protein
MEATGVASGGVVIYDWDRKAALKKFMPSQVTTANIKNALLEIWPLKFNEATGEYVTPANETFPALTKGGAGFSFFPGLGLFDLNLPVPWWAWAIVAGLGAWQANKSTTKAGRYTFGAVAIVAAGNAWMKKVKPA